MPKTIEEYEEELKTVRGQLKNANAQLDQSAEDLAHAVEDKDNAVKQTGLAMDLVGLYETAEREDLEELVHSVLPEYDCEGKGNDILRNTVDTHLNAIKMAEAEKEKEELAHSEEKSVGKTEPPSTEDGTPTIDRVSAMLDC